MTTQEACHDSGRAAETAIRVRFQHHEEGSDDRKNVHLRGSSFTGERIYCGLVTKRPGTGSKPHYHPDETFNYVLQGTLDVEMDGQRFLVPQGCLLHIPPNMVHTAIASGDTEAVYLVWRDRIGEKAGQPVVVEV